ncbi:ROK family transcriptional regulator [Pseudoclavibacter helvolus]|uniref:ROK family transcriptional regulator n=1 Tax=Pseudoclavibacter helvolus TaxID=255205 RepID=UPI003C71E800
MRRGHNLLAVGDYNQAVILDFIRRSPDGVSRVEVAQASGLSAQTVSNVTRRLIDGGLVREGERLITGPGKPRTRLHLDATSRYAVGVHLDPTVITYAVLDLAGAVVTDHRTRTPTEPDPGVVIADMTTEIAAILDRAGIPRDRVLGVGIAAPGPLDSARGVVLDPPMLDGWESVPLRDALSEATGFPVVLEKDVTAAAVAELWLDSGPRRDNFAFLYYGTGIGIGLVINHEVLRGASDNAGDLGHIMVQAEGPVCSCGRRGCVGELVVPHRLVRHAVRVGALPGEAAVDRSDFDEVDRLFTAFAAAAVRGETAAKSVVDAAAAQIARALVSLINLLDIDTVVCGGPFWRRIEPALRTRIEELVNNDPALIPHHPIFVPNSTIGEDVAAVGAGCLVLDQTLAPHTSALLISL